MSIIISLNKCWNIFTTRYEYRCSNCVLRTMNIFIKKIEIYGRILSRDCVLRKMENPLSQQQNKLLRYTKVSRKYLDVLQRTSFRLKNVLLTALNSIANRVVPSFGATKRSRRLPSHQKAESQLNTRANNNVRPDEIVLITTPGENWAIINRPLFVTATGTL